MDTQTEERYSLDPEGVLRAAEGLFSAAVGARAVGCYGYVVLALLPAPRRRGRGMTLRQHADSWRGEFEELRRRVVCPRGTDRLCALVATGPEEVDALAAAWAMADPQRRPDRVMGQFADGCWLGVRPLLEQPHRTGRLLSATARF